MGSVNILSRYTQLHFPLKEYGYCLRKILNNQNRWDVKLVCSILDEQRSLYVSTSYTKNNDYLKFLEASIYLSCNRKLSAQIVKLFPEAQTVVCEYIGEFLYDYLLNNPDKTSTSLIAIFDYLQDVNCLNRARQEFVIPAIIKEFLQLSELSDDFNFLFKSKDILLRLERRQVEFPYGCGIEDPHIWNFRIVVEEDKTYALTTDLDYFSNQINSFWELGYLYSTFRWTKKNSPFLTKSCERTLFPLVKRLDLKSEFMFWLGVLSSYCGYRDSIRNLMANGGVDKLKEQYQVFKELDETLSLLGDRILH